MVMGGERVRLGPPQTASSKKGLAANRLKHAPLQLRSLSCAPSFSWNSQLAHLCSSFLAAVFFGLVHAQFPRTFLCEKYFSICQQRSKFGAGPCARVPKVPSSSSRRVLLGPLSQRWAPRKHHTATPPAYNTVACLRELILLNVV